MKEGRLPSYIGDNFTHFFASYLKAALKNNYLQKDVEPLLLTLLDLTVQQCTHPYKFELYHQRMTSPFDYYRFGLDFIRPLIDLKKSKVKNLSIFTTIEEQLKKGENVVFFANHQIEPDPQVISVLLEDHHPKLAEEMIFVAGHRVVTDPMAVPFSLGRNLLCIYSKKHMQHPTEKKAEKVLHNQRTMKILSDLLTEGGKCIYVAPSGGRDRPDPHGNILPDPFDPQSIEMFLLIAKRAKTPTHFYPLVLSTYHILPPPSTVDKEIGERRLAECAPVFLQVAEEINPDALGAEGENKTEQRQKRADAIHEIVKTIYTQLKAT